LAKKLHKSQWENPLVSRNASLLIGNFDMRRCREITDETDRLILNHLGLLEYWPSVLLADARMAKAKGETSDERRDWPFPI